MKNTGMLDKNGIEIKDGDTVKIVLTVFGSTKPIIKNCKVWYEPKRAAFMCDWDKDGCYLGGFCMNKTTFEVI